MPQVLKVQSPPEDEWVGFALALQMYLETLEEGEFLCVSLKNRPHYFVQFAEQGANGVRIEATSNYYIPECDSLTAAQHKNLIELGWRWPTNLPERREFGGHKPEGSPNYFLDLDRTVSLESISALAVSTLRNVFGANHPHDLEYDP